MDIFEKNRNLLITIIVLVLINIGTLLLLWFGKPKPDNMRGQPNRVNKEVRIKQMLNEELGFSDEQAEQFLTLRKDHMEKTMLLENELALLKKKIFEEAMYSNSRNIPDSLLNLIIEKQSEIEIITFQHFQKIKQICTPEQQEKLFKLMHRLLGSPQRGGPPPRNAPRGGLRENMVPPRGEDPLRRN